MQVDTEDISLGKLRESAVGDRADWGVLQGIVPLVLFYGLQAPAARLVGLHRLEGTAPLMIFLMAFYTVMLGLCWLVLAPSQREAGVLTGLHLRPPPKPRTAGLWKIVLACVAVYIAFSFGMYALHSLLARGPMPMQDIAKRLGSEQSPTVRILAFLGVAVLAPFVEEVIFRGALYLPLRNVIGIVPAMFIVAFVFAIGHSFIWGVPQLMLLSCILVVLMEYSRSLWTAIAAHAANNALMLVLLWYVPGTMGGAAGA